MKVRSNAITVDQIDLMILQALQENARQTYTALGKHLGVAHSTVYDRMKRMERYGIIKKYVAIIDLEKTGIKNITALMTIFTDPKESEKVAQKISDFTQVLEVYTSLSEELLIIAKVVARNPEKLHEFIAAKVAPLPGVIRIRTSIITKKFKEKGHPMVSDLQGLTFIKEASNT